MDDFIVVIKGALLWFWPGPVVLVLMGTLAVVIDTLKRD